MEFGGKGGKANSLEGKLKQKNPAVNVKSGGKERGGKKVGKPTAFLGAGIM